MARRAGITNALTKGVLDPDLSERIDLQHHYNSLAAGLNLEARPQGGVVRRAGWTGKQRLRRCIEPVHVTSDMITAHNGGTAANLVDQSASTSFTTDAVSGTPFVVAEIDLGDERSIVFCDLIDFSCASSARDDCIGVQWYDGAAWVDVMGSGDASLSAYKNIRTTARTRRFGVAPGSTMTARYWRVVVTGGTGLGAISLKGLRLWAEKRALSPVQVFSSARSDSIVYECAITGRNMDVFRNRAYVASVSLPIAVHQVAEVNPLRQLDTHLFFHEDVATPLVVRQGQHDEWDSRTASFTNVMSLTAGAAFSGDQNEIQEIGLPGLEDGDSYVIWFGTVVTAPIAFSGTAGMAAAVEAAIEALPGVDAAGVIVTLEDEDELRLRVEFAGNNGARSWPALEAVALFRDDIGATHQVVQPGLDSDAGLFANVTGWPRCGVFTQGRLLLAGFRAAPTSWAVSRTGNFYDFTHTGSPLTADLGFVRSLDTEEIETIQQVFVGRHLQFFTDSSEWNIESRTLDATQPPNATRSTGEGIKSSVRVSFVEGATIFVQQGGRTLRDFLYSDIEGAYKAEPLSLLGPHLLTDVVSLAHRKARSTSEGNMVFMVNADGSLVHLSLLRAQEVIAMLPHVTDGSFRSVASNVKNEVFAVIERETAAGPDLFLEVRDPDTPLDAAVRFAFEEPTQVLTGLEHLNGKPAWAYVDGELLGPLVVTNGQTTLELAGQDVVIGLFPALYGRLPKIREKLQNDQPFRAPARIYEVELSLANTAQVEIRVNGSEWREVPLTWMDGGSLDYGQLAESENGYGPELPIMQRLVTGDVRIQNLRGWSRHPTLEFRQTIPAPFHLKALRYELAMRG